MSEKAVPSVARCKACSKTYRIPDPQRAYVCKACGGPVRAIEVKGPAADLDREGLVLCNDCQTLNPVEAEACFECGADLEGALVVEDEGEAADVLHEAKSAFRRAHRWSRWIAVTYHAGALAYAVATLFAVFALADPQVPKEEGLLVVGLTVAMSVLMGTAALHLSFQPFAWTLAVALLASGVAVVHTVGPNPYGAALLGSAAWAVLSWILLIPAWKFQSGIRHHKDLYILCQASLQTKQSVRGRSPGERHERLLRAMRRADRRAWKLSAVAAVALVLVSFFGTRAALGTARPATFEAALAAFESAWNNSGLEGVEPLFHERVREIEGTWLRGVATGHGWREALPTLPEGKRSVSRSKGQVDYAFDGMDLTVHFVLKDLEWALTKVELPYPPLEPAIERFRSAWNAGDSEALADFASAERRAALFQQLEQSRTRRGWDVFPPVQGTKMRNVSERGATAIMDLGQGRELETTWYFRDDGAWGVFGIKMPTILVPRKGDQEPG